MFSLGEITIKLQYVLYTETACFNEQMEEVVEFGVKSLESGVRLDPAYATN